MKKLFTAILACAMMAGASASALAENWVVLPGTSGVKVDTDSYVDGGILAQMTLELPAGGKNVISSMAFNREDNTYRIATLQMPSKDGKMETKVYPDNPENWSKILPNTLGKTIYTHYVENPLPRFTNPDWVTLYKEQGVRFHGSEYQIEKNTMSYRDGYATFWMRITYPWKDQNFSAAVYR